MKMRNGAIAAVNTPVSEQQDSLVLHALIALGICQYLLRIKEPIPHDCITIGYFVIERELSLQLRDL